MQENGKNGDRIERIRHPRPQADRLLSSLAPIAKLFTSKAQVDANSEAILSLIKSMVREPDTTADPGSVLDEALQKVNGGSEKVK